MAKLTDVATTRAKKRKSTFSQHACHNCNKSASGVVNCASICDYIIVVMSTEPVCLSCGSGATVARIGWNFDRLNRVTRALASGWDCQNVCTVVAHVQWNSFWRSAWKVHVVVNGVDKFHKTGMKRYWLWRLLKVTTDFFDLLNIPWQGSRSSDQLNNLITEVKFVQIYNICSVKGKAL